MTRFLDEAIGRAGLMKVLGAVRAGDREMLRATMKEWRDADLLALGAVADIARQSDAGDDVHIHFASGEGVRWIEGASDLDVLREVAIARIAHGGRIGVDWAKHGLELAQVALGFGATDLRGPVTKKSGLPILAGESKKVKGEGMVDLAALRKREIIRLVSCAGRHAIFDDEPRRIAHEEAAHA